MSAAFIGLAVSVGSEFQIVQHSQIASVASAALDGSLVQLVQPIRLITMSYLIPLILLLQMAQCVQLSHLIQMHQQLQFIDVPFPWFRWSVSSNAEGRLAGAVGSVPKRLR